MFSMMVVFESPTGAMKTRRKRKPRICQAKVLATAATDGNAL